MKIFNQPHFRQGRVLLVCLALLFSLMTIEAQETKNGDSIRVINDISYYENKGIDSNLTKLNLVIPQGKKNLPVFIWIGGGAWAYVDRNKEMDLCRKMAEKGILMVSVGHRLSPALIWEPKNKVGIKHPEHIKDIAKAFKWTYENIEEYGGSKENIFVGGYSSGAQLSALLAADKKYLEELGLSTKSIKAVIPVAGCYDIQHYREYEIGLDSTLAEKHIYPVFGLTDEEHIDASPITYIEDFDTPMLMVTESYAYIFSVLFEKALHEKGYKKFQVLNAHQETHNSLWTKMSKDEHCIYRDYIIEYIKSMSK